MAVCCSDHRGDLGVLGGGGGSSSTTRGSSDGEMTHSRNWLKLLKELRLPSNPLTICLCGYHSTKRQKEKRGGRWGKKYMVPECFFNR